MFHVKHRENSFAIVIHNQSGSSVDSLDFPLKNECGFDKAFSESAVRAAKMPCLVLLNLPLLHTSVSRLVGSRHSPEALLQCGSVPAVNELDVS